MQTAPVRVQSAPAPGSFSREMVLKNAHKAAAASAAARKRGDVSERVSRIEGHTLPTINSEWIAVNSRGKRDGVEDRRVRVVKIERARDPRRGGTEDSLIYLEPIGEGHRSTVWAAKSWHRSRFVPVEPMPEPVTNQRVESLLKAAATLREAAAFEGLAKGLR